MNLKKIIIPALFCLMLLSFIIMPALVSAQGLKNINQAFDVTAQGAGVKGESNLIQLIAMLVQILLGLVGLVFVVLIIYGGVVWMTAMGTEEKITKAKKMITNSVIGLVIIILSYSLAYFITMALEQAAN